MSSAHTPVAPDKSRFRPRMVYSFSVHFMVTFFFFFFISALKAPALVYATLKINIKHQFGSMEEKLRRKSINQSGRERERGGWNCIFEE